MQTETSPLHRNVWKLMYCNSIAWKFAHKMILLHSNVSLVVWYEMHSTNMFVGALLDKMGWAVIRDFQMDQHHLM